MSNKSRLQTNNTNLQALINKANALPDAGSGSGGGSAEVINVGINGLAASTGFYYLSDNRTFVKATTEGTYPCFCGVCAVETLSVMVSTTDYAGELRVGGMSIFKFNIDSLVHVVP